MFVFFSGCGGKDPTAAALAKMINWTKGSDAKGSGEVKRAAQEAIVALFNLNPSLITMKLAEFNKEYQELAANLVQSHLRYSSGGVGGGGGGGERKIRRHFGIISNSIE